MDMLIPITEAADLAHVDAEAIVSKVRSGTIESAMISTPTPQLYVSKADVMTTFCQPERSQFDHLNDIGIGIAEASRKYGIPYPTISRWAAHGLIKYILRGGHGKKTLIDEGDIAYMAAKYALNPGQGKWTIKKN